MKKAVLSFCITFLLCSTSYAQKPMPYDGSWSCGFVIQSLYVDLKNIEPVKIGLNRIGDVKIATKQIKKNVFRVIRSDGIEQQFTVLDSMVMLIDNSEQTQVCLRQED